MFTCGLTGTKKFEFQLSVFKDWKSAEDAEFL